jgi:hypothetical protein
MCRSSPIISFGGPGAAPARGRVGARGPSGRSRPMRIRATSASWPTPVERACLLARGPDLDLDLLPPEMADAAPGSSGRAGFLRADERGVE